MINETVNDQLLNDEAKVVLDKEIQAIFAMFINDDLEAATIFINVFRKGTIDDINRLKSLIIQGAKSTEDALSIIDSLTTIAEICTKNEDFNKIVDERIKVFLEFQDTRDHYNEQSVSKDSPTSFVDRYANRDTDNNQGQSTGWCSVL